MYISSCMICNMWFSMNVDITYCDSCYYVPFLNITIAIPGRVVAMSTTLATCRCSSIDIDNIPRLAKTQKALVLTAKGYVKRKTAETKAKCVRKLQLGFCPSEGEGASGVALCKLVRPPPPSLD